MSRGSFAVHHWVFKEGVGRSDLLPNVAILSSGHRRISGRWAQRRAFLFNTSSEGYNVKHVCLNTDTNVVKRDLLLTGEEVPGDTLGLPKVKDVLV